MKYADLKGKTKDQLNEMVLSMKKELFNLRFQRATGEANNTSRFSALRRDIARVKTQLKQLIKPAA